MKDITLVTAFFPVNRENWKHFERTTQKYVDFFKFWARIKNDLIIYTSSELAEEVMQIRKNFNRENTKVVTVDNLMEKEPEMYESLLTVSKNGYSTQFRLKPNNPESWNPNYNYIMHMKYWCLNDASKNFDNDHMLAWIDFGFNHGGEFYLDSNDFDFLWEVDLSKKIHIFLRHDLDDKPIYDICRRMDTYIQGSLIISPASLWRELFTIYKSQVEALSDVGLMDDDQTILLMSYRKNPTIFETHGPCEWHSQIALTSNKTFKTKQNIKTCQ